MSFDPILSICIPTYNHEKYIVQALDSVFKQKTTYPFEVLVGEDCSTDNTRTILKEYEKEHNYSNLKVYYRETNTRTQSVFNSTDLRMKAQGKYFITLEGDDYWVTDDKIQKQIDFLEKNPNYIAVAHNCIVVDQDSKPNGEMYPECHDNDYTIKHFASGIMPGQLATIMCKNYYKDDAFDKSLVEMRINPGDKRIVYSLLNYGAIYCIQEKMSAYRHIQSGGSSFSATRKYNFMEELSLAQAYLSYSKNSIVKKYADFIFLLTLQSGVVNKAINVRQAINNGKYISHKIRSVFMLIKRDINKKVFHKSVYF